MKDDIAVDVPLEVSSLGKRAEAEFMIRGDEERTMADGRDKSSGRGASKSLA